MGILLFGKTCYGQKRCFLPTTTGSIAVCQPYVYANSPNWGPSLFEEFIVVITICTRLTSPSSAIMRLAWSGLLATLFGLVTLLAFPAVASAQVMHAEYVSSDPKASSVLKTAPTKITIHFSEELN